MTKYSGDTSLGRYNKAPRIKVQMAENVNKALEFITSRGVKLTNIGPEGEPFSECVLLPDFAVMCTTYLLPFYWKVSRRIITFSPDKNKSSFPIPITDS